MAKLKSPLMAGFNAGKNYYAKLIRIDDIKIDPELSKIFSINDKILDEIYQKILSFGYDESQPVVLQKDTNILLDGHTRLAAAKKAGLKEIPAVEKEFEDREDAVMYTFERQALRRNLTGAEILTAAEMIPIRKDKDGKGRAAELLAQRINVGVTTIYQAKALLRKAPEEDIQAVKNGDLSIKAAYNKNNPKKSVKQDKPDVEFHSSMGLPDNVKFLKGAVILLVEADQIQAADLLINHYLKKHERNGFFKILPNSIKSYFIQDFDKTPEVLDGNSIAMLV